jgi:hypothetical protein
MLPAYIIEELLRIERGKNSLREIFTELPDLEDQSEPHTEKQEEDKPDGQKRGVVIIDFTI